jgi:hypothetical protein
VRGRERVERLIVPRSDDLIDLTICFFVVEIMHLLLVFVTAIPLAIHVAFVTPRHVVASV